MDDLTVRHVAASTHGRYLLREADHPSGLLMGFHGYAENAERLYQALLEIPGITDWHVAAVQALHPFYNVKTGEVIASWMTKLDRELAIEDNIEYVHRVVADIGDHLRITGPRVYLGFSQGTAMAYRAALAATNRCDAVIALGGDVPSEVKLEDRGAAPRVLIGRGTADEWYDEAKMESDTARLQAMGIEVESCVFEGGHEWTAEFRSACRAFLGSLESAAAG